MRRIVITVAVVAALFSAFIWAAEQKYLPMPPSFLAETDPEAALRRYPLGVITKQAAFSHHGQATRTVTLPNGNEGWVYQVGEGRGLRTYTLVFNESGVVTDVLYNARDHYNGLTALQLQAQRGACARPGCRAPAIQKNTHRRTLAIGIESNDMA